MCLDVNTDGAGSVSFNVPAGYWGAGSLDVQVVVDDLPSGRKENLSAGYHYFARTHLFRTRVESSVSTHDENLCHTFGRIRTVRSKRKGRNEFRSFMVRRTS